MKQLLMNDKLCLLDQLLGLVRKMVSSDFDPNQCCVCFRTYEEDVLEETEFNWIKCVCERWVHKDCINEIIMDKNGRKLICPFCVP